MSAPLESYALIGNCQTAALVGLDGSIDWLCVPNFGSGACFAAILGSVENGRWQLVPTVPYTAHRRYRGDTMILETQFVTDQGSVTLIDLLARCSDDDTGSCVDLVRILRGDAGSVPMHLEINFRFDYGSITPWVQRHEHGIHATAGPDTVILHAVGTELKGEGFHTTADITVTAGQNVPFTLTYFPSHLAAPKLADAYKQLAQTEAFWLTWSSKYQATHRWRDAVMRSLLTLKAMTFAPTGGIVAAPTTSLPEALGGVRNWDYRFCWIRDATLTLFALLSAGYVDEAAAWRQWLLRAAAGKPSELQIMYGIYGERRLTETELPWLTGYDGSKPVRIGNGAHDQFQLDVYGELMGALHLARKSGLTTDFEGWNMQRNLMHFIEHAWNKPDSGIWEVRGPRRHFTHSKVMAWMAADRSIQDAEEFHLEAPLEKWKQLRDEIYRDICEKGYNAEKNAFTQYYGGTELDAALLIIPHTGFLPATDPRVVGTVEAIERELIENGFVVRYRTESNVDGLPAGEAAFLPCSFWLADAYAMIGRRRDAVKLFERLLSLRNDVGLLAEMYDPHLKRQLGNFPQAFTHITLIATAALLANEEGAADPMAHGEKTGEHTVPSAT